MDELLISLGVALIVAIPFIGAIFINWLDEQDK